MLLSVLLMSLCFSKRSSVFTVCFDYAVVTLSKLLKALSVNTKSRLSGLYFTGLRSTIWNGLSCVMLGPSTRHYYELNSTRRLFQRSLFANTLALPKIISPYLALVKATFRRLGSFKKPIPDFSFDLTQDRRIKSFSRPWKLSTEATSICL
jgi:hypothetical protein